MDDRTYRRLFTETPGQTFARHNGLGEYRIMYRRCRGCEGTGRVLGESRLPTSAPHPTCDGTGLLAYKRPW